MKVAVRYFAVDPRGARRRRGRRGRRRRRRRRAARRADRARRPRTPRRWRASARCAARMNQVLCAESTRARRRRRGRLLPAGDRRLKGTMARARLDPDRGLRPRRRGRRAARRRRRRRRGRRLRRHGARPQRRRAGAVAMELEHYPGMTETAIEAMIDEAMRALRHPRRARRPPRRPARAARPDRAGRRHLGAPRPGVPGLRVPDGLPEDAGAVLEEGSTTPEGARWVDARVTDDAALARWGIAAGNARRRPSRRADGGRADRAPGSQIAAVAVGRARRRARCAGRPALWLNARWAGFPLGTLVGQLRRRPAHRRGPVLARALAQRAAAPAARHRLARRLDDVLGVLGRVADPAPARRAGCWPLGHTPAHVRRLAGVRGARLSPRPGGVACAESTQRGPGAALKTRRRRPTSA